MNDEIPVTPTEPLSQSELKRLLRDLNSTDNVRRDSACRQAERLSSKQILELVEQEVQRHLRDFRQLNWLACGLIILLYLAVAYTVGPLASPFFTIGGLLFSLGARGIFDGWRDRAIARSGIFTLLENREDPCLVLPLLQLMYVKTAALNSPHLQQFLVRLLPKLRADKVAQWSKSDRELLRLPLKQPFKNVEITVSLLKALEQIGDTSLIPAVRKLSKLDVWGEGNYTRKSERIRNAARECLPYLEARIEQTRSSETLLRPAAANTDTSEILLRPAVGNTDTISAEQLLRPGSNTESP